MDASFTFLSSDDLNDHNFVKGFALIVSKHQDLQRQTVNISQLYQTNNQDALFPDPDDDGLHADSPLLEMLDRRSWGQRHPECHEQQRGYLQSHH